VNGITTDQVIAVAEVGAVLLAGVTIFMTLRGLRAQLWLQTFGEYTRRYSEIVANLPSESRRPGGTFRLEELGSEQRDKVLNAVRAYLNLCSEEFFLHGRRKIDGETWGIWRRGIEETVALPWFRQTWGEMRPEYAAYYPEFCSFMDDCVSAMPERSKAPS